MVDKATNSPKTTAAKSKTSLEVSDNEWLCRYLRPFKCIHGNGSVFVGVEFQKLLSSRLIVKNPRGNSIAERMNMTISDMLRTMEFDGTQWQLKLHSFLQAAAWTICATISTCPTIFPVSSYSLVT